MEVNNKANDSLISEIKEKRELSGLSDAIIEESLENYMIKRKIGRKMLLNLSKKDRKIIVKEIRSDLRLLHGRFQASQKSREAMLKENKIDDLLKTHSSTKERIPFYPKIKSIFGELKVKSVLDLGCGLNPLALANTELEYYASDINEEDLLLVKKFFDKNKIKGKTFFCDLRKIDYAEMPDADMCLLFKLLDILEKKGHNLAGEIIEKIRCKYILASFSTKKLSGKPMNKPRRVWFEILMRRLNYSYDTIETSNEIFYLIKKSQR